MTDASSPDDETPGPSTIDLLAAVAKAKPTDKAANSALWKAVLELERWWFVPQGPEGQWTPLAGKTDRGLVLLAFTDAARCSEYARAHGLLPEGQEDLALAVPPEVIVTSADQMAAQGLDGITFDSSTSGFSAPMSNLKPMWTYLFPST